MRSAGMIRGAEVWGGSPGGERSDPPKRSLAQVAVSPLPANGTMIAGPIERVIVQETYLRCHLRSAGIAGDRRIEQVRNCRSMWFMPRLACFKCGRTLWATVPLAQLFA